MIPFAKHMFQMGHQNHQDLRDAIDEQKRLRAQSEASELIPSLPETEGPFLPLKIDLPKRKGSYSNHPFSAATSMLVGRWIVFWGWFRWISLFGVRPWKSMVGSEDSLPFWGLGLFWGANCLLVSGNGWWIFELLNPSPWRKSYDLLFIIPQLDYLSSLEMGRAPKRKFLPPTIHFQSLC